MRARGVGMCGAWLLVPLGCGPPAIDLDEEQGDSTGAEGAGDCETPCDDCSPSHVWSRGFDRAQFLDVAAYPQGGVVVAGYVAGGSDLGGGPLPDPGGHSILVGRFSGDGTHVWSRVFGNSQYQGATAVAIAANGDVLLTGFSSGEVDFGGAAIVGEVFLVRLDVDGEHIYSRGFEASSNIHTRATDIAVDNAGNTFIIGRFSGPLDLGDGPLGPGAEGPVGAGDMFLGAFDPTGVLRWSHVYQAWWAWTPVIAVDGDTNIRLVTGFEGSIDLGGGVTFTDPRGLLLARLDGAGQHLDSRVVTGASSILAGDIVVDGSQDTIITGYANGTIDFGAGPESVDGAFLLKYAADGSYLWSRIFDGDSQGFGLATDAANNVLLIARSEGTNFGGGPLLSSYRAVALAKFDACGQHLWSRSYGSTTDWPFSPGRLAVGSDGELYAAGRHGNVVDFGGGPLPNLSSVSSYVVRLAAPP